MSTSIRVGQIWTSKENHLDYQVTQAAGRTGFWVMRGAYGHLYEEHESSLRRMFTLKRS